MTLLNLEFDYSQEDLGGLTIVEGPWDREEGSESSLPFPDELVSSVGSPEELFEILPEPTEEDLSASECTKDQPTLSTGDKRWFERHLAMLHAEAVILNKEEQIEYGRRLRYGDSAEQENARDTLRRSVMRLCWWWVKTHHYQYFYTSDGEDLIQQAYRGVERALDLYDYTYDVKFSYYASFWIHCFVSRAAKKLWDKKEDSMDRTLSDEVNGRTGHDVIADTAAKDPVRSTMMNELARVFDDSQFLNTLCEKERVILEKRLKGMSGPAIVEDSEHFNNKEVERLWRNKLVNKIYEYFREINPSIDKEAVASALKYKGRNQHWTAHFRGRTTEQLTTMPNVPIRFFRGHSSLKHPFEGDGVKSERELHDISPLWDPQQPIHDAIIDGLHHGEYSGTLDEPARTGKGVILIETLKDLFYWFLNKPNARALYITENAHAVVSAAAQFALFFPEMPVGVIGGRQKDFSKATTILTYRAFVQAMKEEVINPSEYDVVIADEYEWARSERRLGGLDKFDHAIKIGASGTGTYSGSTALAECFPHRYHRTSYLQAMRDGLLTPYYTVLALTGQDIGSVPLGDGRRGEFHKGKMEAIVNCPARNQLLVDLHRAIYPDFPMIGHFGSTRLTKAISEVFADDPDVQEGVVMVHSHMKGIQDTIDRFLAGEGELIFHPQMLSRSFDAPRLRRAMHVVMTQLWHVIGQRYVRHMTPDPDDPNKVGIGIHLVDQNPKPRQGTERMLDAFLHKDHCRATKSEVPIEEVVEERIALAEERMPDFDLRSAEKHMDAKLIWRPREVDRYLAGLETRKPKCTRKRALSNPGQAPRSSPKRRTVLANEPKSHHQTRIVQKKKKAAKKKPKLPNTPPEGWHSFEELQVICNRWLRTPGRCEELLEGAEPNFSGALRRFDRQLWISPEAFDYLIECFAEACNEGMIPAHLLGRNQLCRKVARKIGCSQERIDGLVDPCVKSSHPFVLELKGNGRENMYYRPDFEDVFLLYCGQHLSEAQ